MPKIHRYYVYILKCSDDSFYIGVTSNIELRFNQHQTGLNKTAYTYSRRPLALKYVEEFQYIDKAIEYEKKLKGWTRRKKQALIDKNWEGLKEFSKCLNETSHERRWLSGGFDSAQPDNHLRWD